MPQQIKIKKWIVQGFNEIRRTPEVQQLVDTEAASFAKACGKGYEWSTMQGKTRYRAIVFPDTYRAYRDARRNNTMFHQAAMRGYKLSKRIGGSM